MPPVRKQRVMADHEKVFVVVALDEIVEFEQEIGVFFEVVLARVAERLVVFIHPPGRVEDQERQAVGQFDFDGAGEAVVGQKGVAPVEGCFDEAFLAGDGFEAAGEAVVPVVIAGDEDDTSVEIVDALELRAQVLFVEVPAYGARVGEAAAVDVVAEKDDSGAVAGLVEVGLEQRKHRLDRVERGAPGVAEEEDAVDHLRRGRRRGVFPVDVGLGDVSRRGASREHRDQDNDDAENPGRPLHRNAFAG